jgi:hypothetical protein
MDIFYGIGWFWILGFAVISGFLHQLVLELNGVRGPAWNIYKAKISFFF